MGTPAECRQHASECINLATETNNSVHRNLLLGLAAKWLQLAGAKRQEIELIHEELGSGLSSLK